MERWGVWGGGKIYLVTTTPIQIQNGFQVFFYFRTEKVWFNNILPNYF